MSDDEARRSERDRALVVGICGVVSNIRHLLNEWIHEELKDQLMTVELVKASTSGIIQTKAIEYEESLFDMDRSRLPEAVKAQKSRVDEVERAHSDNPFDDYMYLEESTYRLERMARMIFRMRRLLDDLSRPDLEAGAADPEVPDSTGH
jgi:hypothetical protein